MILNNPIHIIGLELRTTNDNSRSFYEIPPFWEKFIKNNYAAKIPNKINNDIYAVYTHFENQGKNNQGMYSLIIGYRAEGCTSIPAGLVSVTIPSGHYRVFTVPGGRADKVGETWQSIWAIPNDEKTNWSFCCEFEHYKESGEIDIFIGQK